MPVQASAAPPTRATSLCWWRHRALVAATSVGIFVGADVRTATQGADPSVVGRWSPVQAWPVEAVHAALLPTGRVFFYAYHDGPHLWNPATGAVTSGPLVGYNTFCAGHSFLADGSLLLAGGHIANSVGLPNASIYNATSNTWSRVAEMGAGRWYPTNTTLPTGDVLVVSGSVDTVVGVNRIPQIWQTPSRTWRDLSDAPLNLPLYPWMFVAPDGRVFEAGPNRNTKVLDVSGTGAWTPLGRSGFGNRDYGSAVMFDEGKVLIAGGGNPPTNTAEVIDLGATTPEWQTIEPMAYTRRQMNLTLLPDGSVLATGGSSGSAFNDPGSPVYATEIWDPVSGHWTTVAGNAVYRGYHSTALLLPDGRVLSAGGDGQPSAEVYSPPYLFKGERPVVGSAPAQITYGQKFLVGTASLDIAKITMLRLSSVTHSINMDQRINRLSFSPTSGGISVTAPATADLCPPGYYMLFLVNNAGVPSVAKMVRIGAPTIPSAPSGLTAKPMSSSRIDLRWIDKSDNEDSFSLHRSTDGVNFVKIRATRPNLVAYGDTGLAAGVRYFYRVQAVNAAGSSVSNTVSASTLLNIPTAPTNLRGVARSSTRIDLAWTDTSTNESGFKVEGSLPGSAFVEIARLPANARSYSVVGATSRRTYAFRIQAYNSSGKSYSNTAYVSTP